MVRKKPSDAPMEKKEEQQQAPKEVTEQAPKETKQQAPKEFKGYTHIDTFLDTATIMFSMSGGQAEGFKAYMNGSNYQFSERDFLPHLEKYLGRKLDI